ncbi:MAG TPA: DUF3089 domain-containing protein [Rhizomicrobium sp.]|nr:DUF3089 domain-containing protein [Rhizomicrobium sp.]
MKRAALVLAVVILAMAGIGLAYGQRIGLLAALLLSHAPRQPFAAAAAPPAPDYAQKSAWAADGGGDSNMWGPAGQRLSYPESRKADVFFIHPTTYFSNDHWNQPLDDADTNARTDTGTIRNQASAFNLCCRLWAPRYRQMTFGGFLQWSDSSAAAMDFAYSDVARAFAEFLGRIGPGKPFIVASHSQGSRHALRLLAEEIDGTPLAHRMVAAYVAGTWIDAGWFAARKDLRPCDRADDTGCVLNWSTLLEGSDAQSQREAFARRSGAPPPAPTARYVCTNPLDWSRDGSTVPAARDVAWVYGRGDKPRPVDPREVSARCDNGGLFVSRPKDQPYAIAELPGGNYHNYDYQLFYGNIRDNAVVRVDAWWKAHR